MRKKSNEGAGSSKDDCQTPAYALGPVLRVLARSHFARYGYKKKLKIWESFCGEGILIRALRAAGFLNVMGTDLKMGKNFFLTAPVINKIKAVDLIISNPPFSKKYKVLKTLYAERIPFFLLVPIDTLGAGSAQALFKKYGITFIFLDRRVNFKMPFKGWDGDAPMATLWLYWNGIPDGKQESIYETTDQTGIIDYDSSGAAIMAPPKVKRKKKAAPIGPGIVPIGPGIVAPSRWGIEKTKDNEYKIVKK